jgi:hypothetical protein
MWPFSTALHIIRLPQKTSVATLPEQGRRVFGRLLTSSSSSLFFSQLPQNFAIAHYFYKAVQNLLTGPFASRPRVHQKPHDFASANIWHASCSC